jgi:hypothetical protein
MALDMARIADIVEDVEDTIEHLNAGTGDSTERQTRWQRAAARLAQANEHANMARLRQPGELFTRRLVIEHCERLLDQLMGVTL